MKKTILIVIVVLAAAGYAASFLPLDFLQPSIERALAHALGRRVEIGRAHLTFLNGPGVALDQVTIHEDPRAGIEPFAYAETVQARLDLLALIRGRVGISRLRFDDASLNLVKPDNQPWNFQMLLATPAAPARADSVQAVPAIAMRAGRVNIKYGQMKSVLFFNDVDMNISPAGDHLDLRFSGVPARTDRPVRNLEHFFIRGTYQPTAAQQLRLSAELQPTPMDAAARLFVADIFPLNGSLTANAEISGAPANLDVKGEARLDTGAKWSYQGTLSLPEQQLQLQSAVESSVDNTKPVNAPIRIHVWDLLKVPHWEIQLEQAPIETFVGIARRLGASMPDPFSARGKADGSIAYRGPEGIEGKFDLSDILLGAPSATRASGRRGSSVPAEASPLIRIAQAAISIQHSVASFGPASVGLGPAGAIDVSARYNLAAWNGAELRVASKSVDLGALNPHVLASLPVLSRVTAGTFRGTMSFEKPHWFGNFDLQNATMPLDGFAEPLSAISAAVAIKEDKIDVMRLRARLDQTPLTGEYHADPSSAQPHTFRIQAGEISPQELERLFSPALARSGGFLSRTFGLGSPEPAPNWLAKRQAAGIVSLQVASESGDRLKLDGAHVAWEGSTVRIGMETGAVLDNAPVTGELRVDLSGPAPQYHFAGKVVGFSYKGGRIDADGELEATGMGAGVVSTVNAQGTFVGQGIRFAPEAVFRKASGSFAFRANGPNPRLTLSDLEVMQGGEVYHGTGNTDTAGTVVLELTGGGRTVRYSGSLEGTRAQSTRLGAAASTASLK